MGISPRLCSHLQTKDFFPVSGGDINVGIDFDATF